ncbi:MAG: zinc ribbon domain-containing protein, partial [Bacteroidaceae bacterium]|nr:zinc ribbon domain-containing protein [Bacteroidaceae bacterium]
MYCIYCGAKIDDDAKFCTECGKKQLQDTPVVEEKASTVSSQASLVSKVLAELHDSDIIAADTKGEMRCPSSAAQTAFMRLIAKGILTLLCLFLLPLGAFAQNTISEQVSTAAGTIEATITFNGRPIKCVRVKPEDLPVKPDVPHWEEHIIYRAYGVELHKGDRITITGTVRNGDPRYRAEHPPTLSADYQCETYVLGEVQMDALDSSGASVAFGQAVSWKLSATLTIPEEPQNKNYWLRASLGQSWVCEDSPSDEDDHIPEISLTILGQKGPNGECQDDAVTELTETEEEAEADVTIDSMASSVEDEEAEQSWVIPAAIAGAVAVG